jgi:hypothetical protein
MPFAVGTIILSFALAEWHFQDEGTSIRILEYLRISLRALLLVLPLVIGLQGVLWGIGSIRLHKRGKPSWLRYAFLGVLLFLASFLVPDLHRFIMAPLRLPLEAAFTQDGSLDTLLAGVGLSCLYLAVGLVFFYAQSRDVNLSLAAQETSHIATIQLARSYWQFDLADALQLRQRLGTTRAESRLLAEHSGHMLFWKDLLQSLRTFRGRQLMDFVWVFALSLVMFRPSNWAFQMVICGIWTISVGGLSTRRLRSDLARWWLLRSLPLQPGDLMRDEVLLSLGLCAVASETALVFSSLPAILGLYAAILLLVLVANATLAASYDILRHSKARLLMVPSLAEENVPRQEFWGVLEGLISVLIPFGMLAWSYAYPRQPLWGLMAFPVGVLIARFNIRRVLSAYRWIE